MISRVSYPQTRNNIDVGDCVRDRYRAVRGLTPSGVNSQTVRSSGGWKHFAVTVNNDGVLALAESSSSSSSV